MADGTLYYFPIPGTPGELCRVTLHLGGFDWKDNVVPGSEWGALKASTKYGQMPVLRLPNGTEMTQSKAMARYLARTAKTPEGKALYPDDPLTAFQIDEFWDAIEDARSKFNSTFSVADQAEKEAARAALFVEGGAILEELKKIEAVVANEDGYFVGGKLTLADLALFVVVNQFRCGFLDGVPTSGWLQKLPKLEKIVNTVANTPAIKTYYTGKAASNKLYAVHANE